MIRTFVLAMAVGVALVAPVQTHAQNMPDVLRGLMTGNQNQDQAVRDAYERGYQKGRQDEAQNSRRGRGREDDRRDENDGRQQYDRNGNPYRR